MEVFLHNLPSQGNLSDRALKVQLQPVMRLLSIDDATFDCEKAPRNRYASITFLFEEDGRRFLKMHGATVRPGRGKISRLNLLGARIMCEPSSREVSAITLRGLAEQVEKARQPGKLQQKRQQLEQQQQQQRQQQQQQTTSTAGMQKQAPRKSNSHSFWCTQMDCGYYKFEADQLFFVPEYTEYLRDRDSLIFGKRHISLRRVDSSTIHISLTCVHEIVWSPRGEIALTLTDVPIFLSAPDIYNESKRTRLTALDKRHAAIVGTCLVYVFTVRPDQMHLKMQYLSDLGGLTVTRYDLHQARDVQFTPSERLLKTVLSTATAERTLPFPLLLMLHALVTNAYLHPQTVQALALALIAQHKTKPISVDAMKQLFRDISYPSPNYQDPDEFEVPALMEHLAEAEENIQKGLSIRSGITSPGQNLTPVYRAVITPTRMTLHGPELENKNRVLRKFPNHHDYFIRVQFCEEDGQSMRFSGAIDLAYVYNRFRRVMVDGIQVAGRTYSFLGWSHSSLRSHSMWFTAPFIDDKGFLQTHFSIIADLGNFDKIRSPPRCAARIGQAFSETPFAVPLNNAIQVRLIPDKKSLDEKRVFSDGVGTISSEAAAIIWKHIPHSKRMPTCFQIRYAGAKGMLSLDTTVRDSVMSLRPSMIKFDSSERTNLEICDMAAQPIPFYLNRQLIKILEDMGVPKSWFLRLQNDALQELRLIASSAYNMANYLQAQAVAVTIKLHKVLLLADKLGMDYRSDSFLRRATDAVILRELRLLKHKARIFVPSGITLFGVMDETLYLREGEVYVTFGFSSRVNARRYRKAPALGARILVTRSPALHPGDIQLVTHVVPPEDSPLRHLTNCIVFSALGERDLPSQLSGGDLDGDIFNIIWDSEVCLLPTLKIFAPADYPLHKPLNIGRPVTKEDIADFFVDFIKTDHLGTIATRHMILADQLENGTLEKKCIEAAELHSTAVDFSKTGIPADLRRLPRSNKFRPDFLSPGPIVKLYKRSDVDADQFMEHSDDESGDEGDMQGLDAPRHKYYRSEKILGILYRNIDERKIWKDDVQRTTAQYQGMDLYEAFLEWATAECGKLGCYDWQGRMDEAMRIRSAYDDAIVNTMYEFSEHPTQPITELEVFIGTIINKTGAQTIRQRDRSRKLHEEYERISGWITAQIRESPRRKPDWKRDGDADSDDGYEDAAGADNETDGSGSLSGGGWLAQRLEVLRLCMACTYSMQEDKARTKDKDKDTDGGANVVGRRDENEVESFWLVAAAALIRELEFIQQGVVSDMELDMARLGLN